MKKAAAVMISAFAIVGTAACAADEGKAPTAADESSAHAQVIDVAVADFATDGAEGYYRWTYADGRECAATIATNGAPEDAIFCSVRFPDGTPEVKTDVFEGEPNALRLTADGTEAVITEGGPPGARPLAVNHRIAFAGMSCTALPDDGITCTSRGGGFEFRNGDLTRHGTEIPPTTLSGGSSETAPGPGEGYFTDSTEIVEPGTQCGATSGSTPVRVVSGAISCADAIAVIDGYLAAPNDGSHGSSNIREYDGYQCSTTTLGMVKDLGYQVRCRKGDIDLQVPDF